MSSDTDDATTQPEAPILKPWYIYLVETADGSFYAGITTDLERRVKQHNAGKGAKYTAMRLPVKLVAAWETRGQSRATQLERYLKRHSHPRKRKLIAQKDAPLQEAERIV